ncbi:sulfur carrier protein ThiS [Salipaludibacillus agaradhaerens]|uniref:sulfur carrier protein ThiS n=1 Tax=Salipaludibacillus agaradhaerens TaxID=76935 RepID=UPI002150BDE4|nr:sulfur carrier protein ThiS [Salipaludibacillus agaradhaerens]MCR6106240.1 sulfur carrier protein ThiS [Salipaludibacillus agaradhaerens]MCR6118273.1 sulfur carrier protein ThiS [Salipaludibacillus agaradhaerens]UJW57382.1 sulfur carrier protein ThiS [Bacillus sp. A116_S68]
MLVHINGKEEELPGGMTAEELLDYLQLSNKQVVIELNRSILTTNERETTVISEQDVIEIVQFVGGG